MIEFAMIIAASPINQASLRSLIALTCAAAVLLIASCAGAGAILPEDTAAITFANGRPADVAISWGSFGIASTAKPDGTVELGAYTSATRNLPANTGLEFWYYEAGALTRLGSATNHAYFNFKAGSSYTLTLNADLTYALASPSGTTTGATSSKLPPVVFSPTVVNSSTDQYGQRMTLTKGNLWYLPTDKQLFAAFKLRNDNAVAVSISDWTMTFKDASGAELYTQSDYLVATSSTPFVYTTDAHVFPFDVDAGADFHLTGLSELFYIKIGDPDTQFTPSQIATIELKPNYNMYPTSISATHLLLPADRRVDFSGYSAGTDGISATLVNRSSTVAYSIGLARFLALDASGSYIGLDSLHAASGAGLSIIAASQTLSSNCFLSYSGLPRIASLEYLPYYTYKSGSYRGLAAWIPPSAGAWADEARSRADERALASRGARE